MHRNTPAAGRNPSRRPRAVAAVGLLVTLAAIHGPSPARGAVDFNREVFPLLSDNCFHCHGPDEESRKGKLRLDTREGAFRVRNGKAVIVPGKSAESDLIRRITSTDPDQVMPPPDSHRKLTPAQVATLTRWIDEGAKWSLHWSLMPPRKAAPPGVKQTAWQRQPWDNFVLARLESEGWSPTPEASRETWLRRVTLDLTGLPPTPAEVAAFAADTAPGAHERVVDRLLDSPRYGERMATDWLDLARFADTHGYQMDRYRPMWAYRDWVIQAFNQNLPYDQFVTWQLAGDLLPNPTREQRLATAFNRLHLQNEEGGIVAEEFRVAYVVDRVNTFGTAFLGLTMECARCHDHKFDPVSMRDFYGLYSFFQNIDESGQTVYFGEVMPVPTMLLSTADQAARLAELDRQITRRTAEGAPLQAAARTAALEWLAGRPSPPTLTNGRLTGIVGEFTFDGLVSNRLVNAVDPKTAGRPVESPSWQPGHRGKAAALNGDNGFNFPGLGHFTRVDPFSFSLWLRTPAHPERNVILHHSRAWMDAGSRGYELLLEDGRISAGLHRMWPGNSLKVTTQARVPTNEWTHVAFTYDGSSRAAGLRIYLNGEPAPVEVIRDHLWQDITYEGGEPDLSLGQRFRDSGFKGGLVDDLQVYRRALTALEIAHLAGRRPLADSLAAAAAPGANPALREAAIEYYVAAVDSAVQGWQRDLTDLRRQQNQFQKPIPEIMVMEELPQPKPARLLKRGAYDAPGDPVTADTPKALPPFPAGAPRNRLGLAQWLLQPDHPLMARVTVNRAWQMMFGQGLVETTDNLGSQGTPPSHPELLDWLARDFVDTGWNMKRLLRSIALSATYRQSSKTTPAILAQDPANQWLARGPARRLTAEMLRDQSLALGGLLAEQVGGPSVKPYQPPGLWEIAMGNPRYQTGRGNDLHRRSLYTYWKRTVPPPAMVTFDAADRNVCVVRRQSTSTPLQALALLNDVQIVEAARSLAERMLREGGGTDAERVAWAFRLVTSRSPSPAEQRVLEQLFAEQRALFAADPEARKKLLAVGEHPADTKLDPTAVAAGTVLAQGLLNHDGAVYRR